MNKELKNKTKDTLDEQYLVEVTRKENITNIINE